MFEYESAINVKYVILSLFTVADDQQLILIGIHTDPDEAVEEIDALMDVHSAVENKWKTDDILILGDLNADCSYASNKARKQLKSVSYTHLTLPTNREV